MDPKAQSVETDADNNSALRTPRPAAAGAPAAPHWFGAQFGRGARLRARRRDQGAVRSGFHYRRGRGQQHGQHHGRRDAIRADIGELERRVLDFRARDHMHRVLPVMDPARITAFLDDILGGAHFADCAVPLTIVATDLQRRAPATLYEGPVALAAFASSAVPFLHRPVAWGERLLADGALSCVLPTAQARGEGVDLVIGPARQQPAHQA